MASTDLVTCGKFDASQAAQDAAILALQNGGAVTPAAVASAVDAMTLTQLAAMCAKLNCQPTAAALTAALLGLSGSGVAGNVLTIVGGAPVWQAPVAGPATSVPATGVGAGTLGGGVVINNTSNFGVGALATDTAAGVAALNLGTAAGDATNATDALTAAGLAAILNGTAPNTSPNALQTAVTSNPSQYATITGVGVPTAAPTAAAPATVVTNANGEVFRWNGSVWGLSENGYFATVAGGAVTAANNVQTTVASITCPRDGFVTANYLISFAGSHNALKYTAISLNNTGEDTYAGSTNNSPVGVYSTASGIASAQVVAGQVVSVTIYVENGPANVGDSKVNLNYIK